MILKTNLNLFIINLIDTKNINEKLIDNKNFRFY